MTACARDHLYAHSPHLPEGYSFAQSGPPSGPNLPSPPIILLTLYPHFSLLKASALVGIGSGPNVVHTMPAAPDDELAFDLSALRSRLAEEQAVGRGVIVTYGLGEANTGGFGRGLDEVAVMCKEYGAWLHVDGGENAVADLADFSFRRLCGRGTGVEGVGEGDGQADSLTLDGE